MSRPKTLRLSNFARMAIAHILEAAGSPGGVLVPGLGVFFVASRPARTVRHPQTKELMRLPETKELRFRAVKAARESIVAAGNGPPLHEVADHHDTAGGTESTTEGGSTASEAEISNTEMEAA